MSKQKIYGLRIAIGIFVFIFFKITSADFTEWSAGSFVSLGFAILIVLLVFEILDYTSRHLIRKYKHQLTSYKTFIKFYWGNCLITAPFVVGGAYVHDMIIVPRLECPECDTWEVDLVTTIAQGLVLSWLIILAKTFMIYMEYTRRSEREKALIQKELAQSKFESLKDQIKPHFLFNSFSVLTTIIEEDPKLAVSFVSKLSKIYRYVLDNTSQLVSLQTELEYLEDYTFLLKTRHQESVVFEYDIQLSTEHYRIPILSLQMLFENALKHNYFSKEDPLNIKVYNENEDFIVVSNNLNKRESNEKETKLGLQNIMNRYQMLLDKAIVVDQNQSSFTVKLPLIKPSEIEEQ